MSIDAYQELLNQHAIQYFTAEEVFTKGLSNENPKHKGYGLNTDPPECIWLHSIHLLRVLDALREELGGPIYITNCYRAPAYNEAVGGGKCSQHMSFTAADIASPIATPVEIHKTLLRLRNEGFFLGGLGIYNTFVHVDIRGWNADWDNRTTPETKSELK